MPITQLDTLLIDPKKNKEKIKKFIDYHETKLVESISPMTLYLAINAGVKTSRIERLIKYDAKPNEKTLSAAIRSGRDNIINLVIDKGAETDINSINILLHNYFKYPSKRFNDKTIDRILNMWSPSEWVEFHVSLSRFLGEFHGVARVVNDIREKHYDSILTYRSKGTPKNSNEYERVIFRIDGSALYSGKSELLSAIRERIGKEEKHQTDIASSFDLLARTIEETDLSYTFSKKYIIESLRTLGEDISHAESGTKLHDDVKDVKNKWKEFVLDHDIKADPNQSMFFSGNYKPYIRQLTRDLRTEVHCHHNAHANPHVEDISEVTTKDWMTAEVTCT